MCFYCFFRFWRNLNVPCSPYLFTIYAYIQAAMFNGQPLLICFGAAGPAPVLNESSFAFYLAAGGH